MISVIARSSPASLTDEDRIIFLRLSERGNLVGYRMRVGDRIDAEHMYMLTDEAPGAARQLMGLTRGQKIQKEETPANRGGGL